MVVEAKYQIENLVFLVYISKEIYKRVPECPPEVTLDLETGLWRIGGRVFKIGEALLTFEPAEGAVIGIFDRTRPAHMMNMYYVEREVVRPIQRADAT